MEKFMMFAGIFALLNTYVVTRLLVYAPFVLPHKSFYAIVIILLLTAVEMAPFFVSRMSGGFDTHMMQKLLHGFYFFCYVVMGAFFCSLFYMIVGDIAALAARFLAPEDYWPAIKASVFWGVISATVLTTVIGIVQTSIYPKLVSVSVPIKNLPDAFDGYKIVQISDLHVGPFIRKRYVNHVVAVANEADADMIALTGDLADGAVQELREHIWPLSQLQSRDGAYLVLGNHEYYWNLNLWLALYKEMRFKILLNDHEVIARDGEKLVVAGVTDYSTRKMQAPYATDIAQAAQRMPQDAVKVLLAHQPTDYRKAAEAGFDLQLSGHTHGGQFFPWSIGFHLFHKYLYGLGQYKDMWIYVTRGTGYWGPPLRTFAPSEIVLLTLRKHNL